MTLMIPIPIWILNPIWKAIEIFLNPTTLNENGDEYNTGVEYKSPKNNIKPTILNKQRNKAKQLFFWPYYKKQFYS